MPRARDVWRQNEIIRAVCTHESCTNGAVTRRAVAAGATTCDRSSIEVDRRKRKRCVLLAQFSRQPLRRRPVPRSRLLDECIAGTKARRNERMDGRTAFLKGHFVPLSRVFSLATRAMSSLGAAGGRGRSKRQGRRGRGIEAEGSSEVY